MIDIQKLTIQFPSFCLKDVTFTVPEGTFFILLGPTGSGKTLLIESIAGIVSPTSGTIHIGSQNVTRMPPEKRHVGIVYQDYALFPHLSVIQNIRYGLRYCKTDPEISEEWIENVVQHIGIKHLMARSIKYLSGGECQRVALARALAVKPSVLLLDEPLSALDPVFREDIQKLLKHIHQDFSTTIIMVTHDFREARYLGQQVAVIHSGRIEQEGPVDAVFQSPVNPFVRRFLNV